MNNSYALRRPLVEQDVVVKRQRRKKEFVIKSSNDKHTFEYVCFHCSAPIKINAHGDTEIECEVCSSRIIRKNNTNKDRVVEAI